MRIDERSRAPKVTPAQGPQGPALVLLGGHEAASEPPATLGSVPEATKHPPKATVEKEGDLVLRRKGRGQFLTGHT